MELVRISRHQREVRLDYEPELEPCREARAGGVRCGFGYLRAVRRLDLESFLLGIEAACRERIVEETSEARCLVRDDREQRGPHLVAELMLLKGQRSAVHRRQRRPELMRDDGDELVLEAVELAEALEQLVE